MDCLRFLALGDSYTIGEGVDSAERWPVQLSRSVRELGVPVLDPEVIARTGWTTDELAAGIDRADPQGPYALVSLAVGVNDQYRGREVEEYRRQFAGLLDQAVSMAAGEPTRVLVLSIPDWGITPFAEGRDRSAIADEIDAFNRVNEQESERAGVHWVNITRISRETPGAKDLVAADGLHPSSRMYEEWVVGILPIALRALRAAEDPGGFGRSGIHEVGERQPHGARIPGGAMTGWDERYSENGWAFGVEPNGFLSQEAHQIPLGRVLCLGEGEGRNAVFLAKEGFEVVGVDQSPVGMEKAQALARQEEVSIETVVSSIEDFDLQEAEWEGIVSVFFHLPPDARRKIHEAVVKGLKRKGVFILEAFTPRQLERGTGGPPHPDRLVTLEILREELEGLDLVVARECEREVREGRMHTGLASVVQVVGVRV